jgi:hypothetical protein
MGRFFLQSNYPTYIGTYTLAGFDLATYELGGRQRRLCTLDYARALSM